MSFLVMYIFFCVFSVYSQLQAFLLILRAKGIWDFLCSLFFSFTRKAKLPSWMTLFALWIPLFFQVSSWIEDNLYYSWIFVFRGFSNLRIQSLMRICNSLNIRIYGSPVPTKPHKICYPTNNSELIVINL